MVITQAALWTLRSAESLCCQNSVDTTLGEIRGDKRDYPFDLKSCIARANFRHAKLEKAEFTKT